MKCQAPYIYAGVVGDRFCSTPVPCNQRSNVQTTHECVGLWGILRTCIGRLQMCTRVRVQKVITIITICHRIRFAL